MPTGGINGFLRGFHPLICGVGQVHTAHHLDIAQQGLILQQPHVVLIVVEWISLHNKLMKRCITGRPIVSMFDCSGIPRTKDCSGIPRTKDQSKLGF